MNLFPTITRAKSGDRGHNLPIPLQQTTMPSLTSQVILVVNNISIIITGVLPEVVQAWFFFKKVDKKGDGSIHAIRRLYFGGNIEGN